MEIACLYCACIFDFTPASWAEGNTFVFQHSSYKKAQSEQQSLDYITSMVALTNDRLDVFTEDVQITLQNRFCAAFVSRNCVCERAINGRNVLSNSPLATHGNGTWRHRQSRAFWVEILCRVLVEILVFFGCIQTRTHSDSYGLMSDTQS